jgi:uncharacterized protein (DUF362 family)
MSKQSRRDFLAHSATAAGMLALGADKLWAAPAAGQQADMTIARWDGLKALSAEQAKALPAEQINQIARKLTEKALEGLGGIGRFVTKGSVVWVKPNIAWDRAPEFAANTNPEVVATIVRLCLEAGAKVVKVGDNPCHDAAKTYVSTGIPAAVAPMGAQVVKLDPSRFKEMTINGEHIKTLPVCPEIIECDLVINVPIAKHHVRSEATMCMKNYMGVIDNRKSFHQALPECITELTQFMKPRLCVLDMVRILTAHGPVGGDLADVQVKTTVAAGVDIVALDAFGAEVLGRKPADIGSVVLGEKAGLGKMD